VQEDKKTLWVSRSAVKLADYLEKYPISIHGKKCLDIGASTGGFTQVLLSYNADSVVALDVGSSQLHPSLRNIENILSLENTDIREYQSSTHFDIIVTDVSFISLRQIIPSISRLSNYSTHIILLFKPQFEVGKNNLRKTGVPKNDTIIQTCLLDFQNWLV
jgi:23S rRNA (cytidine1920-2'-O)/16S rRNA (cytidine1409-2'-O)-methyltransferase